MKVNKRTQAERSATTRAALVAAGRKLFAENGFASVSTPSIATEAGVTRGALYHQFADKTELFAAVFEEMEQEVLGRVLTAVAASGATDPMAAMMAASDAWLDICSEPEVHQIVLIEAPAALGWDRWREIGQQYALGTVEALLQEAIDQGVVPAQPVRPLAHIFIGAVDEGAMYVARADDPETARAEVRQIARRLIRAVALE